MKQPMSNGVNSFDVSIANKQVRIAVISYALIKILFFVLFIDAEWWLSRIAISLSIIAAFFIITGIKRFTKRQLAVLVPYSMVLLEIANATFFGGDRIIYTFFMGVMIISIMYIDQIGLLIMCILTAVTIFLCLFVFNIQLLGENHTLTDEIYNFSGTLMLYLFGYFFSKYILSFLIKLQAMGQSFNAVLETTPNLMCVATGRRKIEYISESFINFLGKEKNKIQVVDIFSTNELMEIFEESMTRNILTEKTVSFAKSGEQRRFIPHTLLMSQKESVRFFEFAEVTPIIEAQKAAEQANESKSRFLATMSHEIRTPMNAIIGISDIELERDDQPSETRDAFDRINSSGKTLLGIINDILDLSKVETGKLELVPVKYDTPSLINDTARLNVMRIGRKPIEFIIKVSETLPAYLIGDELRIKQILNNILSNAIKYTEQGSVTFEIDSRSDENGIMLVFTVRDTGQGMTKEQLAALYDEYSMFNREANRRIEGTGLGMSITKSLVEMMGGRMEAESEPGKGSTFTVYMLQQPTDEGVLGKEVVEKLQNFKFTPGMQRAKVVREYMPYGSVLVVDDVSANVFVAKGLMKPYGLAIDTAESGYEALEKVGAGASYDVIFMDYMMPGMDGMQAAKLLRERGYTRPIIALTANAVAGMKEMFCANGFDDFVSKPIDIRQLNHVLNSLVRDKQPPKVIAEARRRKESGTTDVSSETNAKDAARAEQETGALARLKQIDGLLADAALEAMGGLEDVYIDTVKLTARLLPERVEKMNRFISTDQKAFTIEVHGLKSVLKNIGAAALGNSAMQLERAATENNLPYCVEHYPIFRTGLLELYDRLTEALRQQTAEPKKTADRAALMQAVSQAKAAAEVFDQNAALEILTPQTACNHGDETNRLLNEAMSALEVFDCERALANLIKLEEKKDGKKAV